MSNNDSNLFQVAMRIVSNGDKTLDKLAKPMAAQFQLDGSSAPYQVAYDDAVAAYAIAKGNKAQQSKISQAWALASKRAYYHLNAIGFRLASPSIRSGGDVTILLVAEARKQAAAENQAKVDKLNATIATASARSEAAKIEKMQQATPESIAEDLRQVLDLSGVSLASVARILYHGDDWSRFVRDVTQLDSANHATAEPVTTEPVTAEQV